MSNLEVELILVHVAEHPLQDLFVGKGQQTGLISLYLISTMFTSICCGLISLRESSKSE